jgi:hypothetical protein
MVKRHSLGKITDVTPTKYQIADGPLSIRFAPPVGDSPGDLFKYLVYCQSKQFGATILSVLPDQRIHERHLKILLGDYDPLTIKRAIMLSSLRCNHVYSIKIIKYYAKRITEWMQEKSIAD